MEKVKAIGLGRKSPDDKEDTETSLRNQRELFNITANNKNWELVKVFEDANISGSKRVREGLDNAVQYARDNDIGIILVKDSSRFIRDSSFFKDFLIDRLVEGIKFYSIMKGNFLDPYDMTDKILSVVDEETINKGKKYAEISEELKVSQKLPCIPAPFGYKYNKDKKWIIIKRDAKKVLSIVQDYVNKRSYKATVKDLKIQKTKYYRVIKNAKKGLYSGFVSYNKKIKDSSGNVVDFKEVKYNGSHKPIISEELYNKVNGGNKNSIKK